MKSPLANRCGGLAQFATLVLPLAFLAPQTLAATPIILGSNQHYNAWDVIMVVCVIGMPVFALLASFVTFVTPRGTGKWLAIGLTLIHIALEPMYMGADHPQHATGLISSICAAMITTRLWIIATPRFYAVASVCWATFISLTLITVFRDFPLSGMAGRFGAHSEYFPPLLFGIFLAGFIAFHILSGAVKRGMPLPPLIVLVAGAVTIFCIAEGLSLLFLLNQIRHGRGFHESERNIYAAAVRSLLAGSLSPTMVWHYFQRRKTG